MAGYLQIIIYLLCIYLVYKGIEIFQIAFQSQARSRKLGMILGVLMTIGAIGTGVAAVVITELVERNLMNNLERLPKTLP
ncbi:MAG: hypothetical protein AB7F88_12510 [Pyrinomonadaceae bacterium]